MAKLTEDEKEKKKSKQRKERENRIYPFFKKLSPDPTYQDFQSIYKETNVAPSVIFSMFTTFTRKGNSPQSDLELKEKRVKEEEDSKKRQWELEKIREEKEELTRRLNE